MTRIELIQLIGNILTRLDVLRGSLLPGSPFRVELDALRWRLDNQQLRLANSIFNDNTAAFQAAASQLKAVNDEIGETIADLQKVVTTLTNFRRLVGVVDEIVNIVFPLV